LLISDLFIATEIPTITNNDLVMNKQFLKNIRDNMPESLKYLTSTIFRDKLVWNKEFCKYYDLLVSRESLDAEKAGKYQMDQLKEILMHSYQNVPYYRKLFDKISFDPSRFSAFEQMESIPFLTKAIIKENFDKLTSRNIIKNGSYLATTGGSTGEPLKVLLDYDSIFKENAFIYYFRKRLGYNFDDKLATFRGIEFGKKLWKLNPMYNELVFSPFKLSRNTLKEYVVRINKYKPQYLNGYLSSLYMFAKLLDEYKVKLNIKLKGIFLISEDIDDVKRSFIEQFFSVKSLTFYGHSERCVIAEEIFPKQYSFDSFYGYTELIKNENDRLIIVGTGFLNYTMPLIRYMTDDICTTDNGYYFISGKWKGTDGLYGYNNEYFGHAAFNFHTELFVNVSNYQLVQKEKGKADLLLVVNKNFKISDVDFMKEEIDRKTKGVIEFNIKVVDHLILTQSGKLKMFILENVND
jgi:phenylacetate-CoA ligase